MKQMISISMSNTKMGAIPSFSLPPVVSCNKAAPCCKKGCYIKKLMAIRPTLRKAYERNWNIVSANGGCYTFFTQLDGWLSMYEPKAFRFHVSGDFFSIAYLDACIQIARLHKRTKFFTFTKQFGVLSKWLNGMDKALPPNFSIILSAWDGFIPPAQLQADFPVAWVNRDGDPSSCATVWNDGKIDACKGKCDECGMCFSRKRKDGDIVFKYH